MTGLGAITINFRYFTNLPTNILSRIGLDRFTAIDLETTGLDSAKERIIEIGAVRFVDGVEKDKFQRLVYPQKHLPEEIVRLTGITDTDLKNAPYAEEALPEFLEFIGDDPLVAQNAPFDIGFLRNELSRLGEPFYSHMEAWEAALDTAVLGRALLPTLESHSLSRLADYFDITGGEKHRAEDDARRCGRALMALVELLLDLGVSEASTASGLLGRGVMAEMFRQLASHLKEIGAPAEKQFDEGYSHNLLGSIDTGDKEKTVPDKLGEIFSAGGAIAKNLPGYEPRPKQSEMAEDIAEALFAGQFIMAEAGTGTGKSFAYLAPSIQFAVSERERVIISTNTKNLQEQLFTKDIPFLIKAIPFKFQAALLKGRKNYLCRHKWLEILTDPDFSLADDERTRALTLLFWANRTTTGDIGENSGFRAEKSWGLWGKVASDAFSCKGKNCANYGACFLQRARRNAQQSHIVVANHALVLTDILTFNAVLGEYKHIVIDEAHNLEKAAITHLGLELNIWNIRAFTNKLYRKDRVEIGLLVRLLRKLGASHKPLQDKIGQAIVEVNRIKSHAGEFFGRIVEAAMYNYRDDNTGYTIKIRYGPGDSVMQAGKEMRDELVDCLNSLAKSMSSFSDQLMGADFDDSIMDIAPEISASAEEASQICRLINRLIDADTADWVYWWELRRRKTGPEIGLYSAPLNPGEMLCAHMYPPLKSAVFTSATLTVAGTFEHFRERLGLNLLDDKQIVFKDYGSPFDYERQVIFGVPVFIPGPKRTVEFTAALSDLLIELAETHKRSILVLFTSYSQLNQVYNQIRGPIMKAGFNVLGQGIEGSRSDIFRQFLRSRSILLGTDSFWEGIDAPGKTLELLVVAKLPFAVPSEPVVAAQVEKLESQGRNSFMEYMIPEAAIRLRQGVGRLIRSSSDIGAVLICDTRVINTRWGQIFRDSLPGRVLPLRSKAEMNSSFAEVFGDL